MRDGAEVMSTGEARARVTYEIEYVRALTLFANPAEALLESPRSSRILIFLSQYMRLKAAVGFNRSILGSHHVRDFLPFSRRVDGRGEGGREYHEDMCFQCL